MVERVETRSTLTPTFCTYTNTTTLVGTPFQGSKAVVPRLQEKIAQGLGSKSQKQHGYPPAPKKSEPKADTQAQAAMQTETSTPPHKPIESMYTLLDPSNENSTATLKALRQGLKSVATKENILIACFYEMDKTEAVKSFPKVRCLGCEPR